MLVEVLGSLNGLFSEETTRISGCWAFLALRGDANSSLSDRYFFSQFKSLSKSQVLGNFSQSPSGSRVANFQRRSNIT